MESTQSSQYESDNDVIMGSDGVTPIGDDIYEDEDAKQSEIDDINDNMNIMDMSIIVCIVIEYIIGVC